MPGLTTPRLMCAHLGAATVLLALAGCSGGGGGSGSGFTSFGQAAVPYQASNAIVSSGYSESQIAPDRYRIQVKGPASSSRERLEKIAAARAAEIGRDNRLGYFKLDGIQLGTHCETFKSGGKPGTEGAPIKTTFAVLTAEVAYTKSPPDQTYQDSKSFDQLRAAVDQPDAISSPVLDPATPAQCG